MASNINPKVMIAISKQINELMKKKIDGIKNNFVNYDRYYNNS